VAVDDELERLRRAEKLLVDIQGVAHLGTWEWDPAQPTVYGIVKQSGGTIDVTGAGTRFEIAFPVAM